MAYSFQSEVSDGTLQRMILSIPFYDKEDIHVYVEGRELSEVDGEYSWEGDVSILLRDVVPAGWACTLRRTTDVSKLRLKFSEGVAFTRNNLDDQNSQFLHIGQESKESALSDIYGDVDMHRFRIRNASDPVRDSDYTTKGWVDSTYTKAVNACAASALAALNSAAGANSSAKSALDSAARAEAAAGVVGPQVRESLRRSYANAGYNLVAGSFEAGGVLVNTNDVLLHAASGRAYSGDAGNVPAGTNPLDGGFVDCSSSLSNMFVEQSIDVGSTLQLDTTAVLINNRTYPIKRVNPSTAGVVTSINTTTRPYYLRVGSETVYLCDIRFFSNDVVNVCSFWAAGDGVTDDRASIQAAIDYAVQNQGTVFFPATPKHYSLRSTHPVISTFLYVAPTNYGNKIGFLGGAPQTRVQVDTLIPNVTALMLFGGGGVAASTDRRIEDLFFSGGGKSERLVDYVLLGSDGYHPNMNITSSMFYGARVSCVRLATYVSTFTNVRTAYAPVGTHLEGINPTDVVTSVTMNSCYGLNHDTNAFKFGYITYSTLNSCASDHIGDVAYYFNIARGVSMNSCGAESSTRILKVNSFLGFNINTLMTLSIGSASNPPEALIEFVRGGSATISGVINHNALGYDKVFKLSTNEWGSECVVFTDSSVRPEDCTFVVKNNTFDQPLQFLVYDKTTKSGTWNVTNETDLVAVINRVISNKDVIHDITIQLPNGDLNITIPMDLFGSLTRGSGSITFKGGVNSRIVVGAGGRLAFRQLPSTVEIIFKDCTLYMNELSGVGQGISFTSCNVFLVNSTITSFNGYVQWGIGGYCNMHVDSTSSITTASFMNSTTYKCTISPGTAPKVGNYPLRTIQYKTEPTAGSIGWIRGRAGWVAFG